MFPDPLFSVRTPALTSMHATGSSLTEGQAVFMFGATFIREMRTLRNFITLIVGRRAITGSA